MSYISNRKSNSSSSSQYLPFQVVPWRDSKGEPAVRVFYGKVNADLPGWSDNAMPEGMDGDDLKNPYFFNINSFKDSTSYIVLHIRFSAKTLTNGNAGKHYLEIKKPSDAKSKIENDDVTFILPIAEVKKEKDELKVSTQFFTGNVSFRPYFSIVNGAMCIEFFQCMGQKPVEIPLKAK